MVGTADVKRTEPDTDGMGGFFAFTFLFFESMKSALESQRNDGEDELGYSAGKGTVWY